MPPKESAPVFGTVPAPVSADAPFDEPPDALPVEPEALSASAAISLKYSFSVLYFEAFINTSFTLIAVFRVSLTSSRLLKLRSPSTSSSRTTTFSSKADELWL